MGRALVLHRADLVSILSISKGPREPPGMIAECRANGFPSPKNGRKAFVLHVNVPGLNSLPHK